jgi:VIT1/CCC1 family predicted Fe2+/Mn2+ transporter
VEVSNLIPSDVIDLLERTLGEVNPPLGCTQQAASDAGFRSFWQTLDSIAGSPSKHASLAEQEATRRLFQGCREDVVRLRSLASVSPSPILAVCGLLNSGKSSLVAGFLSQKGRERVLVGLSDDSGTHRFVIWLPESWKENESLWNAAMQQITQVFGAPPQILSEDPAEARRQYNGRLDSPHSISPSASIVNSELFHQPLVATDPLLDELGVGLMDCPDIQSGVFDPMNGTVSPEINFRVFQSVADERARILLKGLRIASGLIVVAQSNLIRERTLQQLMECAYAELPHTRLFVAVNRVPKRYTPSDIKLEVHRHYLKYRPQGIYMAYDFRGPDSSSQIPAAPDRWVPSDRSRLPIFFDIESNEAFLYRGTLAKDDYLVCIGSKLDASQLAAELISSTIDRVITELKSCNDSVHSAIADSHKRMKRLYEAFSEAILQFTTVQSSLGSNVRLQLSQEIIDQVRQSLERTAPWWARPSQAIGRWSTNLGASAKDLTNKIPGLPSMGRKLGESVEWIRSKIRSGDGGSVMTGSQLAGALRRSDRTGELPATTVESSDAVVAAANNIISRFQNESHARLDDAALDRGTSIVWKTMSWKQKLYTGVAPATLVFAPLIAVVTIPVDFGTTHVLVFATVKELLVAGVASAGIFLLQSDQFPELAESQAAWQQVSDLFAITCDEFGCPRPNEPDLPTVQIGKEQKQLLRSGTKTAVVNSNCLTPILRYQPGFDQRFTKMLNALSSLQSSLRNRAV